MSFVFFKSVLKAIGRKLNYESVVNLYGNAFCKDAGKYISQANPLNPPRYISSAFAGMLAQATIIKTGGTADDPSSKEEAKAAGDLDWAEGLFGDSSPNTNEGEGE